MITSPSMEANGNWESSKRFQAAASAERQRIMRELDRTGKERAALRSQLASIESHRKLLEEEMRALDRFAGGDAGTPRQAKTRLRAVPDQPHARELRGIDIRVEAVRVLRDKMADNQGIHYRDWFELLLREGYMPRGKDPMATFLTQVSRSPVVKKTTKAGVYRLDHEFLKRACEQQEALREELRAAQAAPAELSVRELSEARQARSRLVIEIEALDRQLEEALRSLGPDPHS